MTESQNPAMGSAKANTITYNLELHTSYPEYLWYPGVLANASSSGEDLAFELRNHIRDQHIDMVAQSDSLSKWVKEKVQTRLGVQDVTNYEIDRIVRSTNPIDWAYNFADIISRRAQIGWSTHGHSGTSILPQFLTHCSRSCESYVCLSQAHVG